jgi:hypothetical protein
MSGSRLPKVNTLTVFDDGTGPALYAGGLFTTAGGVPANHIAKWDGTEWSAVGSGMGGNTFSPQVNALTLFDDGTGPALYAGGEFTTAGGVAANRVAKWDPGAPGQWSTLGSGIGGDPLSSVVALTVFDDGTGAALYAAGDFTTAGDVGVNSIAKWDGTQWSALGSGMNDAVFALAVFDDGTGPALYAGGLFTTAGGVPVNRIAKWDGTQWSALDRGADDAVYALAVFDDGTGPALHVGGNFTTAGDVTVNRIAKWDGTQWSALGSGMDGTFSTVLALAVFDDGTGPALCTGGLFTTAGDVAANRIAKWDGKQWSALGSGMSGTPLPKVSALAVFDDGTDPALYAGGGFFTAGGVPAEQIAKWHCVMP